MELLVHIFAVLFAGILLYVAATLYTIMFEVFVGLIGMILYGIGKGIYVGIRYLITLLRRRKHEESI